MNCPPRLGSTLFEYGESGFDGNNRRLWGEIAEDTANHYPNRYRFDQNQAMGLRFLESIALCPLESSVSRVRILQANVIRHAQQSIYIELSLGNIFERSGSGCLSTAEISARNPRIAKWIREVSQVSLREHVGAVRQFICDADELGWDLPMVDVEAIETSEIILVNNDGKHRYRDRVLRTLARNPLYRGQGRPISLITRSGEHTSSAMRGLREKIALFNGKGKNALPAINTMPPMTLFSDDHVGVVLVPDHVDFGSDHEWRDYLATLEQGHRRFKIVKESTIQNRFASENIGFDLFLLDEGCPWAGQYLAPGDIVAVDAGHHREQRVSLWVSTGYNTNNNQITMGFDIGKLHEDLPASVVEKLPTLTQTQPVAFYRDGRFHKGEVDRITQQGMQKDSVFSVTKRPGAVLFRGSIENPESPVFGDCVRYPDGSILMQSIEPSSSDYDRPIRLRGCSNVPNDVVTDVLTLCKQPTLGLFRGSRLPAPIYWADLASKRTVAGWAKAIGRGWGVPALCGS